MYLHDTYENKGTENSKTNVTAVGLHRAIHFG